MIFFRYILPKLIKYLSKQEIRELDALLHKRLLFKPDHLLYLEEVLFWDDQIHSWGTHPTPIRPSNQIVSIYKKFLLEGKIFDRKILILGSTPELRDLVATIGQTNVYIADISYKMPVAMLRLTRYVDPLNEVWIRCNWLDLPFPKNFFDVVLGDLILQQVAPESEPTLLKKINFLLKKDGKFIGRFNFLDKKIQNTTIEEIIQDILQKKITFLEKLALLKLRITWLYADLDKRELNKHISLEQFNKYLNETRIDDPLLKHTMRSLQFFKKSSRNWALPSKEELEKLIIQKFEIIDQQVANDYDLAEYYPIFSLKQK